MKRVCLSRWAAFRLTRVTYSKMTRIWCSLTENDSCNSSLSSTISSTPRHVTSFRFVESTSLSADHLWIEVLEANPAGLPGAPQSGTDENVRIEDGGDHVTVLRGSSSRHFGYCVRLLRLAGACCWRGPGQAIDVGHRVERPSPPRSAAPAE